MGKLVLKGCGRRGCKNAAQFQVALRLPVAISGGALVVTAHVDAFCCIDCRAEVEAEGVKPWVSSSMRKKIKAGLKDQRMKPRFELASLLLEDIGG